MQFFLYLHIISNKNNYIFNDFNKSFNKNYYKYYKERNLAWLLKND